MCLLAVSSSLLAEPIITFTPRTTADGKQIWIYTAQWTPKALMGIADSEAWLADSTGKQMARYQFCAQGWETTSRREASGTLVVEGRCK